MSFEKFVIVLVSSKILFDLKHKANFTIDNFDEALFSFKPSTNVRHIFEARKRILVELVSFLNIIEYLCCTSVFIYLLIFNQYLGSEVQKRGTNM